MLKMIHDNNFMIIGHRGAAGLAPENTLPSFARALALGVDAIELDIYLVDDALLVFHDDNLERTTNGRGALAKQSLAALRTLDAGAGAQIPLLEEVLELVAGRVLVNVELKGPGTAAPLAQRLARYPDTRFLVSSFNHQQLDDFHALAPEVPKAPLFAKPDGQMLAIAQRLNAQAINLSRRIASPGLLATIHDHGFRSLVYTVNDLAEARQLYRQGANGIFTDYPDRCSRAAITADS